MSIGGRWGHKDEVQTVRLVRLRVASGGREEANMGQAEGNAWQSVVAACTPLQLQL